jgi:hypothetical protein
MYKNKEDKKAYDKEYQKTHKEEIKLQRQKYWLRIRSETLIKMSKNNKIRRLSQRKKCLDHYGNKCSCCDETTPEFLGIDHIDGGGRQHRKQIKNTSIYSWLIKNNFPDGYRILCHNCNLSIGFYGYCPHQGKEM